LAIPSERNLDVSVVTVVAALLAECEKLSPPRAAPLSADIHEEPIASHHVRLALFPLRLDADRTGYVNIRTVCFAGGCCWWTMCT
jgi:hypothetical protein